MVKKSNEKMKKITLVFDLNNNNDKRLIDEINDYANKYNENALKIFKKKLKKDIKMDESKALKKYIENKGDPKISEDIVDQMNEELFYSYAHQAHCKKMGIEIGKYDFFRNELPKYKDGELKKMVTLLINE